MFFRLTWHFLSGVGVRSPHTSWFSFEFSPLRNISTHLLQGHKLILSSRAFVNFILIPVSRGEGRTVEQGFNCALPRPRRTVLMWQGLRDLKSSLVLLLTCAWLWVIHLTSISSSIKGGIISSARVFFPSFLHKFVYSLKNVSAVNFVQDTIPGKFRYIFT